MTTTSLEPLRSAAPPLVAGRLVAASSIAFAVLVVGGDLAAWAGLGPGGSGSDPLAPGLGDAWAAGLLVATVTAYGATCFWLERSRSFARVHAPEFGHARGSAGTWLGWLVPVVDWWFPYQAVRDVRRATSRGERPEGLLALWWLPWLAFTIATDWSWTEHATPEQLPGAYFAVRTIALSLALLPWLRIVREVGADQRTLAAGTG